MKFSLITAVGVLSAISQAAAITIITPWGSTVWTSGGHGSITWSYTTTDAKLNCQIDLLDGNFASANLVAPITSNSTPIACSAGSYDMYPLNDFASGKYWIRIGQAETQNWAYSGEFQFNGKGTVGPVSIASAASASVPLTAASAPLTAAAAASGSHAVASGSHGVPSGTLVVSTASAKNAAASASTTHTSGAEGSMSVNKAVFALGAIAAVAVTL